jgi:hypothetical protein
VRSPPWSRCSPSTRPTGPRSTWGAARGTSRSPSAVADRLEFRVGDALRPSRVAGAFRSVVDSGFLHLFDPEDRDRFVAELAATLPAGGRYYLLAFAVTFPIPNAPRAVTEEEVRSRFSREAGWTIRACRAAEFRSRVAPPVPATGACIERLDVSG